MKVAVIFGGLTRSYKKTNQYFFDMLDGQQVDKYIFTWNIFDDGPINEEYEKVKSIYKPKKVVMEDYTSFSKTINDRVAFFDTLPYQRKGDDFNLKTGLMVQYYTLKRAFQLIDNPNEYDMILKYRFDWMPKFKINWDDMYSQTREKLLYPRQKTHGVHGTEFTSNDLFLISNPDHMRIVCSLYDTMLTDIYIPNVIETKCFVPEYILSLHLKMNNVPNEKYYFPYDFISRPVREKRSKEQYGA